ncbi:MAG: S8 family serine peptidase [Bacteroidetes bacterium]|nr:S8 family serine peptidase [Bacteroidota bacterium]
MRCRTLLICVWMCAGLPGLQAQHSWNVQCRDAAAARSLAAATDATVLQGWQSSLPGLIGVRPLAPSGSKAAQLADWFTLQFAPDADSAATARSLARHPALAYSEPNRRRRLHSMPNDPEAGAWHHGYIRTYAAWGKSRGQGIVVGVLDTGLDYDHPEFAGQIWVNPAEDLNGNGRLDAADINGIDEDGNGVVDDVIGYDFVHQEVLIGGGDYLDEDPDPMDDNQHGTLVAGILAARADNGQGGAGIAPDARIMVLRAFSAQGVGEDDDISRAIIYAADNGARVLNCSFGDIYPSRMMHTAIRYAHARGVVVVASAGNGTGDQLHYPSGFPEVISVSASAYSPETGTEFLWPFSSFGTSVDLCAPGSGIFAPDLRDPETGTPRYDYFSGTSCSAPMVSAAAAMLLALHPDLPPQQVRGILCSTADDIARPGWDHLTGAGRLNIARALEVPVGSIVQLISPYNDMGTAATDQVTIIGTVLHPRFRSWHLSWQAGVRGSDFWQSIPPVTADQVLADTLGTWHVAALPEGEYTLRLSCELSSGQTEEHRVRVVIQRSPPQVDLRLAAPAWDTDTRKRLWVWRTHQPTIVRLHYKLQAETGWRFAVSDRLVRNGEMLLGPDALPPGEYDYFLEATNSAGLTGYSDTLSFSWQPAWLNSAGLQVLPWKLPAGAPLPQPQDVNQDGRRELWLSRYDASLTFGKLMAYEWSGTDFIPWDSLPQHPRFIPKDLRDVTGDGRPELLGNLSDSLFVYTPAVDHAFPKNLLFFQKNGRFPAQFADTDQDGNWEILAKDTIHYYVLEWNGTTFVQVATLPDVSGGYTLSTAPRTVVADLDGDGALEIVFGDADGDFLIYENTGDNTYTLRYTDSTALVNTAPYITAGDLDGDGRPELFVACHTPTLRNEADFEYSPPYWWLRIFKATADNTYEQVWEDHLYNVPSSQWNAALAANLDTDAADELLFSAFPRTLLLDWDGSQWYWRHYLYGSLTTHHAAGDWDQDGMPEFTVAFGDTLRFFQIDTLVTPTVSGLSLQGEVQGTARALLSWNALPGVVSWVLFRALLPASGEVPANLPFHSNPAGAFSIQTPLLPNRTYAWVLQARDAQNRVVAVSNLLKLRTHARPRLLAAEALDSLTVAATFSQPMHVRPADVHLFRIDGVQQVRHLAAEGTTVILRLGAPLAPGMHSLVIDTLLQDQWQARLLPEEDSVSFEYLAPDNAHLYLARWERLGEKEALLTFNLPPQSTTLQVANFSLEPVGYVANVQVQPGDGRTVSVRVEQAVLGTAGYPVTLRVRNLLGSGGETMRTHTGDAVTFYESAAQLSDVYVYPNPVKPVHFVQGCRFANLTRGAVITVYTKNGQPVRRISETEGNGGASWDLRDAGGRRVAPGVYIYRVEGADGEVFEGRLAILE